MFNSVAIKVLVRENARLRRENARKDQMVIDIIDRFVHNRVPERLTQRSMGPSTVQHQTSLPSDAFSSAINDAEQQALALLNRGIDLPLPDIDDDNQDD